jgi:hypothetical protein
MDDLTSVLVAVAEFLMEVNPRLPAFWYSFNENGARSLFYLFGMCEEDFHHLMATGVLAKDPRR